jgi:hypothetical protein
MDVMIGLRWCHLQVGDKIMYKDSKQVVKNFGLLSTEFIRYDGCRVWVCCFVLILYMVSMLWLFQIQSLCTSSVAA